VSVTDAAGPRRALRTMRDARMAAVYVTDRSRKLLGMVSDRDALKLVRRGESSLSSVLRPVPQAVGQDDVLIDLFVPAAESPLPLAVTDAEGRLVGVIPRITLLTALGPSTTETTEIPVILDPVPGSVIDEALAGGAVDGPAAEKEEVR